MRKIFAASWALLGGVGLWLGHITTTEALLMFILAELQLLNDR